MSRTETRAPNKALYLTDYARSIWGYGSLPASLPILAKAPHGDGHGVLVIPGLGASDVSTLTLRAFLDRVGYRTYGWGLGTNIGPTAKVVNGLPQRLNHISGRTGSPVSVIGWSLGGILARRLARTEPDQVRQVITLGSPIRLETHEQSNARRAYNLFTKRHVESIELPLEVGLGPLPVPATSIYSRLDGIVAWRACLDEVSEQSENVEVYSSHFGIGHHPAALWVIADRLALRPGEWEPFRAPRPLRFVYPRPKRRAGTHERERTV
jgi:pimeloyl-ACP methyl ester carboxylesterase